MARHNPASGTTAAGFEALERVVENLETSPRQPFHGTIGGAPTVAARPPGAGNSCLGRVPSFLTAPVSSPETTWKVTSNSTSSRAR
jgi:hypothetical protein